MDYEEKYTKITGDSPFVETNCGDYYSASYVDWLEEQIEKLKMSPEGEAQRSHNLVLEEVRELVKLCNDLEDMRPFMMTDIIFMERIKEINEKSESIEAHFV